VAAESSRIFNLGLLTKDLEAGLVLGHWAVAKSSQLEGLSVQLVQGSKDVALVRLVIAMRGSVIAVAKLNYVDPLNNFNFNL